MPRRTGRGTFPLRKIRLGRLTDHAPPSSRRRCARWFQRPQAESGRNSTPRRQGAKTQRRNQNHLDCGGKRGATPLWNRQFQPKSGVAAVHPSQYCSGGRALCHRTPKFSPLRLWLFAVRSPNIFWACAGFFDAEDAKVGTEKRGGEFSLRPWRESLRPLRLIRLSGILVVASPRCAFGLNRDWIAQAASSKATETRIPKGFKISCKVSRVGLPCLERSL
jgi:hypothetical protein